MRATFIPANAGPVKPESRGLAFWMRRVVQECANVRRSFAPDPVHDLRVALRRCRSMADGFMVFDPDPTWRDMKKEGRNLFRSLGNLRDLHVMQEWAGHLCTPGDPGTEALAGLLAERQDKDLEAASLALQDFGLKRWRSWTRRLSQRAARLHPASPAFQHLALERWEEARDLQRRALRNRTQVSWHRLRIGLKKFRYTLENFLPDLHRQWGKDLKELQDLLGEVHDLDVLYQTALKTDAFRDKDVRARWRRRIDDEKVRRLARYRQKMLGRNSLWPVWRAALPAGRRLETAAIARLRTWASFRDTDFPHTLHIVRLALQIFDGLRHSGLIRNADRRRSRQILKAAGVLRDVGLSKSAKKHQKASYKMIRRLEPPLGLAQQDLLLASLVARYHRGALPDPDHGGYSEISQEQRRLVNFLAGILRLAGAFDGSHDRRIRRLDTRIVGSAVQITAEGYLENDPLGLPLACARHLLETACARPILIRGPIETV